MNGLSNRRKLSKNHCWLRVRTKVWNDRLQALSHSVALEADDGDLETFKEASMMGRVVAPYIASPPWSTMVHHGPPGSQVLARLQRRQQQRSSGTRHVAT